MYSRRFRDEVRDVGDIEKAEAVFDPEALDGLIYYLGVQLALPFNVCHAPPPAAARG